MAVASSTAELASASCLCFDCVSAVRLPTNRLLGVLVLLTSASSGAVGKAPGIAGSSMSLPEACDLLSDDRLVEKPCP
jgi:hypothetical protein